MKEALCLWRGVAHRILYKRGMNYLTTYKENMEMK
jgi:hypothetical protein